LGKKTPQDIVNGSGYPLQIHLESLIDSTVDSHGWRVLVSEHRWVDPVSDEEGFIDMVLEHWSYQVRLVLECKRVAGSWIFLLPAVKPVKKQETRVLKAQYDPPSFLWEDFRIQPESHQSRYCVMEVGGKKDSRTLEKMSGELLISLECLAQEEMSLGKHGGTRMHYLPVIVTTAQLQKCCFDPRTVNIADGTIAPADSHIDGVDCVRFRKNLATHLPYAKPLPPDLRESSGENDRTVLVVQADHLMEFLSSLTGE
jgi:hypothetical protein